MHWLFSQSAFTPHRVVQSPQAFSFHSMSTQPLPQSSVPGGHWQVPLMQLPEQQPWPSGQESPRKPQHESPSQEPLQHSSAMSHVQYVPAGRHDGPMLPPWLVLPPPFDPEAPPVPNVPPAPPALLRPASPARPASLRCPALPTSPPRPLAAAPPPSPPFPLAPTMAVSESPPEHATQSHGAIQIAVTSRTTLILPSYHARGPRLPRSAHRYSD